MKSLSNFKINIPAVDKPPSPTKEFILPRQPSAHPFTTQKENSPVMKLFKAQSSKSTHTSSKAKAYK